MQQDRDESFNWNLIYHHSRRQSFDPKPISRSHPGAKPLPSIHQQVKVLGSRREEQGMGNAVCAKDKKKKTAKVMTLDGAVIRLKPPAAAGDVLRDHPGHSVLEADEVKRLGVRATPLDSTQPLEPGKLYFLAELPRPLDRRGLRRASSVVAAARGSATDRLENLRLSRPRRSASLAVETAEGGGAVRVRVRLPAARVAKLLQESADGTEAAERIVELYLAEKSPPARKERRTRFMPVVDETRRRQGSEDRM